MTTATLSPRTTPRTAELLSRLRPTRHQVIDLVGTGLLVALAAVGFQTTYFGLSWIIAAFVGLLCGLAAAHVTATFKLPGVVTAALLAIAYFTIGGLATLREGLSGRSLATLARTAVAGWKDLLTTLPPVDPQGPLVALPLLFTLVGGATAYGVARRWVGAVRALVVPLALLVLSILLGTLAPAAVLLQGAAFALVAVGYAAARAARSRPALQNGSGARTRAITGALLLALAAGAALVLGPRLPGADASARTIWRTQLEPPFDVSQYPSPLAGYRRYTEPNAAELYDRPLYAVTGLPAGTPMRIAVLDTYDGSVWGAGNAAPASAAGTVGTAAAAGTAGSSTASFRRVGGRIGVTPPAGIDPTSYAVTIPDGGWQDVWLPVAGTLSAVDFTGPRAGGLAVDLRYNTTTGTGVVPARLLPGDGFELTAYLDPVATELPTDLALAGSNASTVATTSAVANSQSLAFLDARIDQWSGRESDTWRKLLAVASVLRGTGAYTDGGSAEDHQNTFLAGHSLARITRFVKSAQLAGNDEQYAATLALVATRLGVPARVVVGAIPDGTGTVKGRDVHAWVEVEKADGTWQEILPQFLVPDRNKKPNQQDNRTEEKKTGAVVPPPAANNPPSVLQGPDQAQNATANKATNNRKSILDPSTWPGWLQWTLTRVGPPAAVLALWYAVLLLAKRRRRSRRRKAPTGADQVAGAWSELVDNARDLGIPLPPNGTRPEQARAIDPKLVPLAQATDAQVFGPVQPDRSVAREHWTQSDSAAKTLRQKTRRRTRIRAAWSTRSLREQARPVLATRKADLARLAAQARRVARITRARTAQLTARGEQS
ncbi:MAG: hypothetical protein IPL93_00810 [Actinomycetales bacterium]|jgi:hypothetical protein|nr:hypothetical protein [Actinomycetales bacterium]HMT33319.1 transglutaminase domain-containing protein [Dermatophilaceae bacterium]